MLDDVNNQGPFLAELTRRAAATGIDYFLFSFFYALLLINFGNPEVIEGRPSYSLDDKLLIIPFLIWFLTFPVMESRDGRTFGKRLMKLQVVRLDGSKLTFTDCCKRRLLDWVDFAFVGLPSIISSTNSAMRQRLGDRWAGTTVVDIRVFPDSPTR